MAQMYKEYAEALFLLAREEKKEQEYYSELECVLRAIQDEPEYLDLLSSPAVPKAERTGAIEGAFSDVVCEHVLSFLCLLCERAMIREFGNCVKEYKAMLDDHTNVRVAHVTSSVELTESEKQRLSLKLEKINGHKIILECSVDSSLLGGLTIELDGKIIDASVKTRLQEVKEVISR